MDFKKRKHLESRIQIIVSQIIFDSIINEKAKSASITKVKLNTDASVAEIFVTFFKFPEQSLFELQKHITMIRKGLASNLNIRKCPLLDFKLDTEIDEINKWEKKFEEINLKDNQIKNLNKNKDKD